jgi:hypothetical protein
MKFLVFILVFVIAFYFAKYEMPEPTEQEINKVISDLDKIEKSENIDDSMKHVEAYNREATREFNLLKEKAKSPASIKFVELTEKQNSLASEGEMHVKKMYPFINSLTPEVFDEPEKLSDILIPLCTIMKEEYIPAFSELIQTVGAKYDLLNENPEISNELFAGEHETMKELLSHLNNTQNRIFEDEKQAYAEFQCEEQLAAVK